MKILRGIVLFCILLFAQAAVLNAQNMEEKIEILTNSLEVRQSGWRGWTLHNRKIKNRIEG